VQSFHLLYNQQSAFNSIRLLARALSFLLRVALQICR